MSRYIQRIIKKWSGGGDQENWEPVQFEGYGPGGVAFIIEGITNSRNRTSQEIKHILSKYGGSLASPGSVVWMFEKYGKITTPLLNKKYDDVEMKAIEAGAYDITQEEDKIIILTKPEELNRVGKALEEKNITAENMEFDYKPKNGVLIEGWDIKQRLENLFGSLNDNDDVQEIYSNIVYND